MVSPTPSVFLLIGTDSYSKEKAIKELSASLLKDSIQELDFKLFYGDQAVSSEILEYLETLPFSGTKRLAVVKRFEKLPQDSRSALIDCIKKPLKSSFIIIDTEDGGILRQCDDALGHINVRVFKDVGEQQSVLFIKQFINSRGKKIDEEALALLAELQEGDLLSLGNELEKLTLFIGDKKIIEAEDIRAVVGKSLDVSAFDLTDALKDKKIGVAIGICHDLAILGKKPYEIIGLISWHFRRIFKAKLMARDGEDGQTIATFLKIPRRYADIFLNQVKAFDMDGIKEKLDILLEADADIKRTKYDPRFILEFALIRLCLR